MKKMIRFHEWHPFRDQGTKAVLQILRERFQAVTMLPTVRMLLDIERHYPGADLEVLENDAMHTTYAAIINGRIERLYLNFIGPSLS